MPFVGLLFKEEIRRSSPISMETREETTPNSDLDWPKENTHTIERNTKKAGTLECREIDQKWKKLDVKNVNKGKIVAHQ